MAGAASSRACREWSCRGRRKALDVSLSRPDHVCLISDRESQSHNIGANPAPSVMPPMREIRLFLSGFGNLEHQTGRGGMCQQLAFGVGDARFRGRGAAAGVEDLAVG